ncbi:hypothetical protein ACEWY4_022641 [Coilia grayii]|uniref:Uncharacterized protein n=1 Tax=Coilia grayii TaxID=363190 RepID=A0ABD1J0R8_9TELE
MDPAQADTALPETKLLTVRNMEFSIGDDVTLPCQLSPASSAVAMEIRWFRNTDCIYRYRNGHVTVRGGYEDRVSVNRHELRRGDVSLRLRESTEADSGRYSCQVISGEHLTETRITLHYDGGRGVVLYMHATIPELVRVKMENSVEALVKQKAEETERRLNSLRMKEKNVQDDERNTQREEAEEKKKKNNTKLFEERMKKELKQAAKHLKEHMSKHERERETAHERERETAEEERERETGQAEAERSCEGDSRQLVLSLKQEVQDRVRDVQYLKSQLQDRERQLEERDRQLEERERQLEERDRQMEERDRQMEDKRERLTDLLNAKRAKSTERLLRFSTWGSDPVSTWASDPVSTWASDPVSLSSGLHDPHPPSIMKRWSMLTPPTFGGGGPGPAPPVSPAVTELRLVLLGGSAAWKRAAGNTILGTEEFGRQASTHTLTHTSTESQHSESRQGEVAGRRLTVVETPDWFCSGLSEKDTRQDVGLCVRLSAPGPHAFLLVVPVEPSEGEERRMLEKMEDIFGEGCWRHTLILFTHAEGLGESSVEELLQTGSQELQQLVEKCGNRCHLLNIKDRPDDTEITQLLEKVEEMVSGNRETFYSSETYQEAERQAREIERTMQRERNRVETDLKDEKKKRDIERERSNMEEGLREEMEEMRKSYEREARVEAETHLMKIILPQLQRNIVDFRKKLEAEFQKQIEAKNREIDLLLRELTQRDMVVAGCSDQETVMEAGMVLGEQSKMDVERESITQRREGRETDSKRLRQIMVKMNRDMEKLRQDVSNLTQTQALLTSVCE